MRSLFLFGKVVGLVLGLIASVTLHAQTLYIIAHKGSFELGQATFKPEEYYLLQRKVSDHGKTVIPINLPSNHPLRQQFSLAVFNRSPVELGEYWDRMSFRGLKPPVVQNSEQSVLLFVSRVEGAIGYVSQKPPADAPIDILREIAL